jgi:hypothetical protein
MSHPLGNNNHNAISHTWLLLQLWGKIQFVEAPGPSELIRFKADPQAVAAATPSALKQMGHEVREPGCGPVLTVLCGRRGAGVVKGTP